MMTKYAAIICWILIGLFAGLADSHLKDRLARAGAAPASHGSASNSVSAPGAHYHVAMPGSALNTVETGADESGDGALDSWIVSANRDASLPESAQSPLSLHALFIDNTSDGRPDELAVAVGPEGRRTEMVFDSTAGRYDLIATPGEGRKLGYTDLNGDGSFDLFTEYREEREPKVERWIITGSGMYRVLQTIERDAHEFVVELAPGQERSVKWNGSQWADLD